MRDIFESIDAFARRHWVQRAAQGLPVDPIGLTEHYVLALHREVDEILDEVPWKTHRVYEDRNVIRDNILEEIADVTFFGMSLAVAHGATYDEWKEAMQAKLGVIEERWRQDHDPLPLNKVVLVDLDGVLCEYPGPFLDWVSDHCEDLGDLSAEDWKVMKHAYRQSGAKRHLPEITENVRAVQALADNQYDIVILSKRPMHRYARIAGDTLYWLNQHNVPFRRLLFADDKSLAVALAGMADKIIFAVDDDPDNVDKLRDLGVKTYHLGKDIAGMTDIKEVKEAYDARRAMA